MRLTLTSWPGHTPAGIRSSPVECTVWQHKDVATAQQPARPWYEAPGTPELVRELVRLRDVGVLGLRDAGMREELPVLLAKAYDIHPRARSSYTAVDRLMSKVLGKLEDMPTYQEAARLEFGLDDAGSSKERRERIWRDLFFVSEKTFRTRPKYERRLIELVAEAIDKVELETAEPVVSVTTTAYIARPGLDQQITSWQEQPASDGWTTHNRVCVVGEPGTGKSRSVAENTDPRRRLWIRAETPAALTYSMITALDESNVRTDNLNAEAVRLKFAGLLNHDGDPKLVVIDGIADPMQLDEFLPPVTRVPVVVITTRRPAASWTPVIEVDDLDTEQAAAMVADLCPDIDEARRKTLAMLLGGRPGAIKQACAFLNRDTGIDVDGFIRALGQDTSTVLSASAERSERSLVVTYGQLVKKLAAEREDSLAILGFIAFAGHANLTPKYVTAYLLGHPIHVSRNETLAKLKYAAAVRPLSELSLVRAEPGRLVVSSLTRALLRQLLADQRMEVFYRAIHSMVVTTDEGREFLSELELFLLGWSPADIASFLLSKFVVAMRIASMEAEAGAANTGVGAVTTDDSIRPEMISDSIWETTYLMIRSLEGLELRDFIDEYFDLVPRQTLEEYWEQIRLMARGVEDAKRVERKFGTLPQPFMEALQRPLPTLPETISWLNEQGIKIKKSQHRLQRWQRILATFRIAEVFREHVAVPVRAGDMLPEGDELLDFCIGLVDNASTMHAYVEKARHSLPET